MPTITGAHAIVYSRDPDADRAFLRDVIGFTFVDAGHGWLIFGLPPSEIAVHPADAGSAHELYLMVDDIHGFVSSMAARGIACSDIQNLRWGVLTRVSLPSGAALGVYEPRHPRPGRPEGPSSDRAARMLYERILTAWNRRDAVMMADQFATDGHLVGFDGSQVDSRRAIARHLQPIFADHPTPAYVAKVQDVRTLTDGVAIVRAVAGMYPPSSDDINPALNTVHTLVAVRDDDGEWRAAVFQSTPAAWHGRPHDAAAVSEELRELVRRGVTMQ